MKINKIILFLWGMTLVVSCQQKTKDQASKDNTQETAVKSEDQTVPSHDKTIQYLANTTEFKEKIARYDQEDKKWTYIGNQPCIVDFYADWCAPCRRLGTILEELIQDYGTQIVIYKVNVDQHPEIAQAYNIQGIPTLLFCPSIGKITAVEGFMAKENLKKHIEEVLIP